MENELVSETAWGEGNRLVCRPTSLEICGREKCTPAAELPETYVVWEPGGNRYLRCDRTGCDSYIAEVAYSGLFANVVLPGGGNVMRVSSSGEYREIAHLMTDTYFYRGQCTAESM